VTNLGFRVSNQTVGNILKRHDIPPTGDGKAHEHPRDKRDPNEAFAPMTRSRGHQESALERHEDALPECRELEQELALRLIELKINDALDY
jgi:hypothetical protein